MNTKSVLKMAILSVICVLLLNTTASAIATASEYIQYKDASIVAKQNGNISISFTIYGTDSMDRIGATAIFLYEDNGSSVDLIETFRYTDLEYKHLVGTNTYYHAASISYAGNIGYKYYARVYFVAENASGGDSPSMMTNTVTAKK